MEMKKTNDNAAATKLQLAVIVAEAAVIAALNWLIYMKSVKGFMLMCAVFAGIGGVMAAAVLVPHARRRMKARNNVDGPSPDADQR